MDSFPILSIIAYMPLIGALLILFFSKGSGEFSRAAALGTSLVSLVLSLVILFGFEHNAEFQYTEHHTWLDELGVSYFLGVDGISVLLIALTTFITTIAIIWSWGSEQVQRRQREYYIALLMLETGMLGVFMALDLFIFYIFWEVMLIPMALLIGIWGSSNRVYASIKFFLYTLAGSLLMLVGIIATYQAYYNATGERTLDILKLQEGAALGAYSSTLQFWVFAAFFIAFAVKVPLFPFHTWLPDAHVESPTAASVILAAVMLKMGGYGLLRFNLPLYPEGSSDWAPVIIVLSIIGIIYGALVALVQPDLKKLIAYSSVSHMGFVTLGIFIMNLQGMEGAMMVMLAHGFNTGALFLLVGVIYERGHTRLIDAFGGLASRIPNWSFFFLLFMFASIGLPGLSGFVGEFLVALGTWEYNRLAALLTFSVVIFAAWYMMWMFQRVVFGRASGQEPDPADNDLTEREKDEVRRFNAQQHHVEQGTYDTTEHGRLEGGISPVSGGDHTVHHAESNPLQPGATTREPHHVDSPDMTSSYPTHEGQLDSSRWPDLSPREMLTIIPLAIMTVVVGVYPKPIFSVMEPTLKAILEGATRVIGG